MTLKIDLQLRRPAFAFDVALESTEPLIGVFGDSGSGKSTLIHLLAGLENPESGYIELDGKTVLSRAAGINVPPHRRRISVMFQDDRLFPHYSVAGNLRYGEPNHGKIESRKNLSAIVDVLELGPLLHRRVHTLSGGERQRVALGRALLCSPALLLLDEPLSSLDVRRKQQILLYLRRVRDELRMPMVYVSHDLTEILQLTSQLLILKNGSVAGCGEYRELAHKFTYGLNAIGQTDLVNVLHSTVLKADYETGVAEGSLLSESNQNDDVDAAQILRIALRDPLTAGQSINVVIRASDVSLATERIQNVSIQNQLRGEVRRISVRAGRSIVEVDVGQCILAELTVNAINSLQLQPGRTVWCLIKSNAIHCLSPK